MTAAEWCVFGTLMLYLLTIAPIKWIGFRRFDNSRPRDAGFYNDDPIASRAHRRIARGCRLRAAHGRAPIAVSVSRSASAMTAIRSDAMIAAMVSADQICTVWP